MCRFDFKEALWGNYQDLEGEIHYFQKNSHEFDHHHYVDLGLPSGTLWATENISETAIKDTVIEIKKEHDFERFVYGKEISINDKFEVENIFLDKVSQYWGEAWITPSKKDLEELIDCCLWEPVNNNGIYGFLIQGQNGNKIFLPTYLSKPNIIDNNENEVVYLTSSFKRGYNKETEKAYIANEFRFLIQRWDKKYSFNFPEWVNLTKQHEKYIFIRPILKYKKKSLEVFKNLNRNLEGVELGLTSGNLWSPINIGFCEGSQGPVFQWGDTVPNEDYDGSIMNCYNIEIQGNSEYDVATKVLGDGWVTPSKEDYEELINECVWERIIKNGRFWGFKVINKQNPSKYIIFPISHLSSYDNFRGEGCYWSSSQVNEDAKPNLGMGLVFTLDFIKITWMPRYKMCYVRPIKKRNHLNKY